MPRPIALNNAEVEAQVAAWVKSGGKVQKVRKGKSCCRPLSFEELNLGGALIEDPRLGNPVPRRRQN